MQLQIEDRLTRGLNRVKTHGVSYNYLNSKRHSKAASGAL